MMMARKGIVIIMEKSIKMILEMTLETSLTRVVHIFPLNIS